MTLGFYYHVPGVVAGTSVRVPGYLGVFLDALAATVDTLVLFIHEAHIEDVDQCDYELKAHNLSVASLGPKSPAWARLLFPHRELRKVQDRIAACDLILVRAPSPLAPAFFEWVGATGRLCYLLVGDYRDGAKHLRQPWWRLWPIRVLLLRNDRQLRRLLPKVPTLVNSSALFEKYAGLCPNLELTRTTTISESDIFIREDTCQGSTVRLLYTGRLDMVKGLSEIVQAAALLRDEPQRVEVDFVAWEDDPAKPVENSLREEARALGILDRVVFHGRKSLGPPLMAMYRAADLYLLPSYHEGFPRTLWEAMANSLPVICTPVGGIPFVLKDGVDAVFTAVRSPVDLASQIRRVIGDGELRRRLISNGRTQARAATLEKQTAEMVEKMIAAVAKSSGRIDDLQGKP